MKGGDKKCVNREQAKGHRELGDVTAAVVGVDAVHSFDVSYPQKRNRKDWKSTESN
jgi:hypothetical protein